MKIIYSICTVVLCLGCGSETPNDCLTDSDCFSGEVCRLSECGNFIGGNDQNNAANNQNNANNGENNANNSRNNVIETGPCLVDPFSVSCSDDGNDSSSETIDGNQGCSNSGDFVPWTGQVEARMCGLEQIDRYSLPLFPCDDVSFILDVTFTPAQPCADDLYAVQISAQDKNCEEGGDDIQCMTLEDGTIEAMIIIRPSFSLQQLFIEIDKGDASNVDFEYTLDMAVRQ